MGYREYRKKERKNIKKGYREYKKRKIHKEGLKYSENRKEKKRNRETGEWEEN